MGRRVASQLHMQGMQVENARMNIESNVMFAKKHCRDMKCKSRPVFKKNQKDQLKNDVKK